MILLKETTEFKVNTEIEAKDLIEKVRAESKASGYVISAAGYTRKEKKSKGEVIAEGFLVKITKAYCGFWDDIGE